MLTNNKIPILLVDDRVENLIALEALLSDMTMDMELIKATSGNDALRYCLKRDFAIILLDVQMPEMTGLETAELLRRNQKTRHIPIMFVTAGLNESSGVFAGYETGAVDYLVKPIEPLILRSKVKVFCELYLQRMEIEYHKSHLEALVKERTAELETLAASLESRVEERTDELRRTMNEFVEQERLASLGRIVAGVAHELNTPIGNIVLIASTFSDRLKDLRKNIDAGNLTKSLLATYMEEYKEAIGTITHSAYRANDLIESFKKTAVDQTSNRRREFDLRETVADVLATLGTQMRHAGVTMDLRIPAGIQADGIPGHIEQIVTNLVINSIRHGFKERGHGLIVIDAHQDVIRTTIIYRDDGVGIAPELHRKVFEPFYTSQLGQGGSGLGLFIVHNLIHVALKGELILSSYVDQGVEFTMSFPTVLPLT